MGDFSALNSIPRQALKGLGGLRHIFLVAFADVILTLDEDTLGAAPGYVNIEPTVPVTELNTLFKKISLTKESSNVTETGTGSVATGSYSIEQVINFILHYQDVEKRTLIDELSKNEVIAVCVDRNGIASLHGAINGMDVTAGVVGSGTAPGDLNGYNVTLRGSEAEHSRFVDATLLALLQ